MFLHWETTCVKTLREILNFLKIILFSRLFVSRTNVKNEKKMFNSPNKMVYTRWSCAKRIVAARQTVFATTTRTETVRGRFEFRRTRASARAGSTAERGRFRLNPYGPARNVTANYRECKNNREKKNENSHVGARAYGKNLVAYLPPFD